MANLALVTAGRLRVVESFEQMTLPPAETIVVGDLVRLDTANGKFTKSNGTGAAEARAYGVAVEVGPASITAVKHGVLDGFDLSGLAWDADVYISDTDGKLADAAGTVPVIVGRVIGGFSTTLGTAADKLLLLHTPLP